MISCGYKLVTFRFCYFCYILGFVIFLSGLVSLTNSDFESRPMKVVLEDCPTSFDKNLCKLQSSLSDTKYFNHRKRVVLVVIDALRADFIPFVKKGYAFNVSLDFTEKLLNNGKAISFVSQGFAPTVTLPRIKTLMTGTVSTFVDTLTNFNAEELTIENILEVANSHGFKTIFYGDNTWIKLFPYLFLRSEGTHSFFVSDFTEVDLNVSRHIEFELKHNDWNMMILHFLGIDHIGHAHGPLSRHLPVKLKEMDGIITLLYENFQNHELPSLIIVCGDHGMTMTGGHGGVTQDELLTPMIFIDSVSNITFINRNLKTIDQVDFASTLSVILGIPIPVSNFGTIIPEVLEYVGFSKEEILFAAYYNFLQLHHVYEKIFMKPVSNPKLIRKITLNHLNWLESGYKTNNYLNDTHYDNILKSYNEILNDVKSDLVNNISGYNEGFMVLGLCIMMISFVFGLVLSNSLVTHKMYIFMKCSPKFLKYSGGIFILFVISSMIAKHFVLGVVLFCFLLFTAFYSTMNLRNKAAKTCLTRNFDIILLLFLVLHAVSFFSSSFIEEEHQTWYFLLVTVVILVSLKNHQHFLNYSLKKDSNDQLKSLWNRKAFDSCATIALLVLHRICRKWNQVGNKWQHLPDISDWLSEKENVTFLIVSLVISLIFLLFYFRFLLRVNYALFSLGIICIFLKNFQLLYNDFPVTAPRQSVIIPWIVYSLITILFFITFIQLSSFASYAEKILYIVKNIFAQWVLLVGIISRPHNIHLFPLILIQEYLLSRMLTQDCVKVNTVCYLIMAKASFFYYGNSNSISTVDAYTGYTGMQSYSPLIITVLLSCNTCSTLVMWLFMLMIRGIQLPKYNYQKVSQNIRFIFFLLLNYKFSILLLYSVVMHFMRHHLFIYSVFFPKLFYEVYFALLFIFIYLLLYLLAPEAK